jgi:hypothetical protein
LVAPVLLCILLGASEPFYTECPDTVEVGEVFQLSVMCVSTRCTGLSSGSPASGPGLVFLGSSVSSSVSMVNTPQGSTRQSRFTLALSFQAVSPGDWNLGPVQVDAHGAGSYAVPARTVTVTGLGGTSGQGSVPQQQASRGRSWITPEVRGDTRGRVYPGVPVTVDYYVYSSYNVMDINYSWSGAERGVITSFDQPRDIQWEHSRTSGVNRAHFFTAVYVPASPGVTPVPGVTAQLTYADVFPFSAPKDFVQSDSVTVDVYPFPEPEPPGWNGTLLDSVCVELEENCPTVGQAGERTVRLRASGPGAAMLPGPDFINVRGAELLQSDSGESDGEAWWDLIVEPADTGSVILGPDTLVWLDRKHARYRTSVMAPCTLFIDVIPRTDVEIRVPDPDGGRIPASTWAVLSLGAVAIISTGLIVAGGRRRRKIESAASAGNLEQLLERFEAELSRILTGRREYLGCDELADRLDEKRVDTLLSRRVQRFWKDLERYISDREPGSEAFENLRDTAVQLLAELDGQVGAGRRQ